MGHACYGAMNPDDSDVSRQNKTGRNIDDIHSIDGSLVMTGVTADDDDREGNAHVMMMLMLSILTMATKPRILLSMMMMMTCRW